MKAGRDTKANWPHGRSALILIWFAGKRWLRIPGV